MYRQVWKTLQPWATLKRSFQFHLLLSHTRAAKKAHNIEGELWTLFNFLNRNAYSSQAHAELKVHTAFKIQVSGST